MKEDEQNEEFVDENELITAHVQVQRTGFFNETVD
jgi:hypothetical protein